MSKSNKNVSKLLFSVIITAILLLAGSCQNWMSSDDFMSKIENEVHDANAPEVKVYVRYANSPAMGTTEPSGNTTMKVDVVSKVTAVTSDDYGFVKWAAFSTSDFATNKNHSNLTFISQEDYDNNIKDKELTSEDIVFSNPTDPVTEVKILKQRDDIFIIPIVAARPTYVQSVPAGGDYGVVKNTSIRILFSKAIDKSTLYDSEGNLNYSITSSAAVLVDDSQDIEAKDITDYFDANLSESGKMLTLKLKVDAKGEIVRLLDNRARITITLFEGLCDRDGFSMSKNYSFNFQTGTNTDSLAPMIEVIFGGTGEKCDVFVSYHNVDEDGVATINGVATDAAKKAPQDINSTEYTDALVAQRIYDKLNLYIKATDVIASGNADINPAKDLNEDNVAFVAIAASLYVDKDGKPVEINETNSIAKENFVYISGEMDSTSQMTSLFNDVVPKDKDGVKYTGGSIYTYDVSNLPDGLIKLDIWGIDMTGNSGGPNDAGSPYYTKHDNGYKSIFVVKDTTAPDSATESKKLKSNSAAAPYYWYNSETLSTMELFDLDDNQIVDRGHAKLRSLAKNLQWNFVVGKSTEAPAASDAGWKNIHNAETGASIKYTLASAKAPAQDGPIDITLYIRDDLGNVSDPVLLNSLMYDNTKPEVTLLDNYGDFVNEDGGKELHSSKEAVINQILKVSFTEPNVNNAGSGIRRVEIHVKKGDAEVAVPLDSTKFKVKWSAAADATPKTASEIAMAADDTATTDKLKVFNVTDSSKITTGTLFIYGLTLGEEDGDYNVTVDLYDSAMNKTTATAKTKISRDKTSPSINTVNVQGAVARTVYGDTAGTKTWWMPKDLYEAGALTKVTLKVSADETGSGLEAIQVGNDVEFTSATILKKGDTELVKGTDYKFDESDPTHKIILLNNYNVLLKGTPIEFTLENVKLKTINNDAGNKINVAVKDFVGNDPDSNQIGETGNYQIVYPDNSTGTLIYADNTPPAIAALHMEDTVHKAATNPDNIAYGKDDYTDEQTVILTLKLTAENITKGSGVKTVHLTDNAEFSASTAIYVDTNVAPLTNNVDYTIAGDNKSVEFTKVFTGEETLKFTNVKIISEVDGNQIIKADLTDFVGLKTTASTATNTIILDKVSPVVSNRAWVTTDSTVTTGTAGEMTIDNQSLKIDFTENTAGVKVIKFNIYHSSNPSVVFDNPFDAVDFYYNDTLLTKDTDYTIDTSNKQYIILTTPRKTGSFMFKNVKLTNTNTQGNYVIDVVLLDAAENRPVDDCKITIAIDKDAPVIKDKLDIPNLLHAVELTTNGGQKVIADDTDGNGTWWLRKDYVGAETNQVPGAIPVYIKVEEKGSGVKFITLGGDATISDSTKLHKIASNGSTTDLVVNADYTVANKTITIINSLNAFSDDSDFQIYLENVGFANIDSGEVSKNTITAKVTDVALHESNVMAQDEQHIYSDSQLPATPTNFKLLDRAFDKNAATPTIEASEDYTNDSIVDMEFELDDSEQFGSGYHKFEITGATFRDDSVITMTTLDGTPIVCNGQAALTRILSGSNKVLTLKSSGSISYNYVIRQAVKVKITNVQLENAASGQEKTVTLTAYDLVGRANTAASDSIWFDDTVPDVTSVKVFTANYTNETLPYYQPTINVYPHADGENGTGVIIEGTPTFYTATTRFAGFKQYNGQVSASESSLVTNTIPYGAVLGIRASDNLSLSGYAGPRAGLSEPRTFLYYIADPDLNKTKAQILAAGSNHETDINAACANTTTGNSKTSAALCFPFETGKYSAVIVDEAGNVSDIFHFAVVQDTTKPDVTDMQNRVLLQSPEGANIYRNAQNAYTTKSTSFDFAAAGYGTSSPSIRTKKYVTKDPGSTNKYRIILNLGNAYAASSNITKIGGGTPSTTVTKYAEFASTASAVKIEQYAISTWYGAFPTGSTSTYTYQPVPPYATSYPSGETNNASTTSSTLATNARNYFDHSNSSYSSYWHAGNGNTSWHSYSHPNGADGTKVTDSGNGIVSYIDKDDNLVIEIPNTGFTAPISVFLRDGCGNMNYVVLGLEGSGTSLTVPSFIVDNKLGGVTTTNGRATTLSVMQNPFMSLTQHDTNKTDKRTWTIDNDSNSFYWNFQGGTGDQDSNHGVAEKIGFLKDKKLNATYYNPRLYIDDSTNEIKEYGVTADAKHKWSKLGLSLRWTNMPSDTVLEDVMFTSSDVNKAISDTDLADEEHRQYDYTCRALLYCTIDSAEPSYSDIVNSHIEGRTDDKAIVSTDRGFRTEWVGVRAAGTDNTLPILIDYPQPNYDFLVNWTANNSKHEPVPYYIWYIYEDRVGNYELAKVVNSKFTDTPLMDRWLYDGAAPDIRVVGTEDATHPNGKKPDEIGNNKEEVNKLVSANNGYVPYLDTTNNRIWVSIDTSRSLRNANLKKSTTGWGVSNDVADGTYGTSVPERSYLPFANLTVAKEITGIRAFCWSNSSTPPAYTTIVYDNNSQGDIYDAETYPNGAWFAGTSINKIKTDIGWGWSDYTKAPSSYLPVTSSSDTYYGTYTGVKINTVLSHKLITASADSELYLHVMDWTGNVASYRMGSTTSGLKFRNDTTAPVWRAGESVTSKPSEYFVNVESDALTIRIAGNGKGSSDPTTGQKTMYIEFPQEYFTDDASAGIESGIAGYVLNVPNANNTTLNLTLDNITKDDSGNYLAVLEIPYSTYRYWSTTSTNVYFTAFDNVGNNRGDYYCHAMLDTTPPELDSVSIVIKKSSGGNFCDEQDGLGTNLNNYTTLDYYRDYKTHAEGEPAPRYYDVVDDIPSAQLQTVYISKENIARFHINMVEVPGDLDDIKLYKWNNSTNKWDTVAYIGNNITRSGTSVTYRLGDGTDAGGYGILECNTSGVIYQICATDKAGNAACQYFKLILDKTGPTLTTRTDATDSTPVIVLGKGSINKITSNGTDTYYYTADSSHKATIKFAMTDAGMKNSKQKFYYSFDNSTWTTINNPNDTLTEINATVASGNLDKIYLKDIFENKSTIDVNFKYTYGSNVTKEIPALTYLNTKPATPTFKVNANDATILTTDDLSGNNSWSAWNTSLLADTTGTIAINGKSLKWTKISFAKSDKIIGYLVTDGAGNLIKEAEYGEAQQYGQTIYVQNIKDTYLSDGYDSTTGSYSFKTDLKDTFTETLPLLINNGKNTSYAQAVRKYYAVDVVGNISDPLTLTYTYSNPSHQAIDIHLIRSLNEIEASDVKNTITAAVNNGTLKLAQIADTIEGSTTTRFFSGDYLLLSCTLKEKASNSNNDTPARVELVDIWSGAYPGSAVRGYATGDNIIVYNSDEKNNENRYYCYVAFKVGNDVGPDNNKQWSYDAFDNNDQWGGSQLYLRVYGKATNDNQKGTESDSYLINPPEEIDIRWKRDNTGPVIQSTYLSGSNVCNYTPSSTINVVYDKDSANTWTGRTNSYSSGLKITIPATGIKDGFTYTGDNGSINSGTFVNYSGVAQYKTVVTGTGGAESDWQSLVADNDGNYTISIPDVTTVHSEIKLYVRDSLGNVSSEYKLGKHNEATSAWWILNNRLTEAGTTVTAPSAGWVGGENSIFDVTAPEGSIIKSVTAKVGDADWEVKGVSFNGYDGTPTVKVNNVQTPVPMSDGWLNLSGLKVTVAPIAQNWNPQSVTITLNDTISKTISNFVPAKKLSASNITLTQATWNPNGNAQTEYNVAITMNGSDNLSAPPIAKLDGMTLEAYLGDTKMTNITVDFDETNSKFIISGAGIPTSKTWATQVIKIKISDDNNIVDGSITLDAMTIAPISADDITIKQLVTVNNVEQESDIVWNNATVDEITGERTFKLKFNCPTNIPTDTSISSTVGSVSSFNVDNQTAILKVKKAWESNPVTITIGDVAISNVLTVPALDADDITISSSPAAWAEGTSDYTLTVTVKGNGPLEASNLVLTNASVKTAWNATSSTLVIAPATQDWGAANYKDVSLKVKEFDKAVFRIPGRLIQSGNIKWGTIPGWTSGQTSYEIPVSGMNTLTGEPSGLSRSLLTGSTVKVSIDGTIDDSITGSYNSDSKKFVISGNALNTQGWSAKQVSLNISDGNISGTITKDIFSITAKKVSGDNITLTPVDWHSGDTAETEYTINVAYNGANPPTIATLNAGLSVKQGSNALTATFETNDAGNYQLKLKKFNVTQNWTAQTINVSITGTSINGTITADVLKVPAKVAADYITVTPTSPAAWASGTTSVTFTVAATQNSGLTISEVSYGGTKLTASNNAYTITAAQNQTIAEDVTITIKAKHSNVTEEVTKSIFPVSVNPNRFFGRIISGTGLQDVYTFGDSPKTAGALQSHVVEVPKFIQKFWQNDETAADEVSSTVTKEAKKAEKKSSKKSTKKAAKKAVEAVKETTATIAVTELPVEALEEPKADDQLAMILPKTANTEEAEVIEPQASVSTGSVDVSVTEAEPASEKHSSAAIWVVLLAVLSSVAGLIFLKKRKVSA